MLSPIKIYTLIHTQNYKQTLVSNPIQITINFKKR